MSLALHRIRNGLRHPRKSLEYVLLGSAKFKLIYGPEQLRDTCDQWKPVNTLEHHMTSATDIHEHLATLWMLAVEYRCLRVLELGTRSAESTIALLLAAKRNGGQVTSIDTDACLEARRAIARLNLTDYWSFIQQNDLQVDWRLPIDFLFVDTSHAFEQTFKELERFEPHIVDGGIIVMHDIVTYPTCHDAIMQYIDGRADLRLYRYLNNNGLAIIFKGNPRIGNQQGQQSSLPNSGL